MMKFAVFRSLMLICLLLSLFLQITFSKVSTTYPNSSSASSHSIHATQAQHKVFEPQELKSLDNVRIRLPLLSSHYSSLSTLSTEDISLLSTTPLTSHNTNAELAPFGSSLIFQFSYSDYDYNFNLTLDPQSVISHDSTRPTSISTSEFNHNNEEQLIYPKKSTYRGSFVAENGEDLLIVTILPINYDSTPFTVQKPQLETQSASPLFSTLSSTFSLLSDHFSSLSTDQESGRQPNGYTIMGTLYKHDGTIYQIDTFTTLIAHQFQTIQSYSYQYTAHINTLTELQSTSEGKTTIMNELSDTMKTLSNSISALSDSIHILQILQLSASYDLGMYKMDTTVSELAHCGTTSLSEQMKLFASKDAQPDKVMPLSDEISTSPLNFAPLWTFERWDGCHRRINSTTIFNQRVFISESYSEWVSNMAQPEESRVMSRVAHLYTLINLPSYQQFGLYWRISSFELRVSKTEEIWNVSSDKNEPRCSPAFSNDLLFALAALRKANVSGKEQKSSLSHLLLHCSPTGSFTSGIAFTGQGCKKEIAAAWSLLVDPGNYITSSHETTGHSLLALEHPFGNDGSKRGTYGGILDYTRQHLPDTIAEVNARGKIGFNRNTDEPNACSQLEMLFNYNTPEDMVLREDCYVFAEYEEKDQPIPHHQDQDDLESNENDSFAHPAVPGATFDGIFKISPTCGNGIVEPYEDCDVVSECCVNCRFIPHATCDGTNPQCCKNCGIVPSNDNRCQISGLRTGFCFRGTCLQMFCNGLSPEFIDICPASMYFNQNPKSPCVYSCPTIDQQDQDTTPDPDKCHLQTTSYSLQWFFDGAHCITPDTNELGLCMQNGPFDSGLLPKCKPLSSFTPPSSSLTAIATNTLPNHKNQLISTSDNTDQNNVELHQWHFDSLNTCDCPRVTKLNGIYTCRDPTGHIVAQSFCETQPKPEQTPCFCNTILHWMYGSWNTTCGFTNCQTGLYSRQSWCEKTLSNGSVVRTISNDCEIIHGSPDLYKECQIPELQCKDSHSCTPNSDAMIPYRICITKSEDDGSELPTSFFILITLLLVTLCFVAVVIILCVLKKCHLPPFHGRNLPGSSLNGDHQDIPLESSSFERTNTAVLGNNRTNSSSPEAYQQLQ